MSHSYPSDIDREQFNNQTYFGVCKKKDTT